MYRIDELDRVIALDGVPQIDIGAPLPIVVADDNHLLLGYLTANFDTDKSVAIVQFQRPSAHFFGLPNDETLEGHPLVHRGLNCYGVFEVVDSSWIRTLERMNSVHSRHDRTSFLQGKRHFIFTFHDNTFECVARGYEVEKFTGTPIDALVRMCGLLDK
jgi:hypothetical protein